MKYIYIIAYLVMHGISFSGEDTAVVNLYRSYDSLLTPVEYKFAGYENRHYKFDSLVYFNSYDSVKSFVDLKKFNGPVSADKIDFNTNGLLLVEYRGVDCLSKFDIKMLKDEINNEYKFIVKAIYGGCRAGGKNYTGWFLMPKLPDDYKITYHWYYVDGGW